MSSSISVAKGIRLSYIRNREYRFIWKKVRELEDGSMSSNIKKIISKKGFRLKLIESNFDPAK